MILKNGTNCEYPLSNYCIIKHAAGRPTVAINHPDISEFLSSIKQGKGYGCQG